MSQDWHSSPPLMANILICLSIKHPVICGSLYNHSHNWEMIFTTFNLSKPLNHRNKVVIRICSA